MLAKTEGPWANWFEAIPIERAGDGFKLRWRDYRNLPPVIRPRFDLALICPDSKLSARTSNRPEHLIGSQVARRRSDSICGPFSKNQTTFISRALPNRLIRDCGGEPAPGTTPPILRRQR